LSRRGFLGAAAIAGLVAVPAALPARSDLPDRFSRLNGLWPAPPLDYGVAVTPPPLAIVLLNRAAYGPRPGDIDAFNALGANDDDRLSAWLDEQLNPTGVDPEIDSRLQALLDSAVPEDNAAYDTIGKSAIQLWTEHSRNGDYLVRNRPVWQMERLTLLRAAYSQWQLREVLYDFWFNHFNVYGREFPTYGMMPNYDAEIRTHIFGNFGDMLRANARTASMLYYLDNSSNTWPRPNENYAREVLELHTLGAVENYYGAVPPDSVGNNSQGQRAGYTEIDVFEFAKALTGWGVSDTTDGSPDTGEFMFRPARHYDDWAEAPITVMDVVLTETNGENDVTDILDYLANHYGTARYIAWKLCVRLVSDNPPPSLVDSTAQLFHDNRAEADQLKTVYRHILESAEFRDTWGEKIVRPVENFIRAFRAAAIDCTLRIDDGASNSLWGRLDDTGHYPFGYAPPTGYPDERALWQGSGPLIMTWRLITYMLRRDDIVNLAEQTNDHFTVPADRTASNIVDWWIMRIRGYAMDANSRARILQFVTDILLDDDPGFGGDYANEPLDTFTDTVTVTDLDGTARNSTYQRIIRGLVGLIVMAPDSLRR
jgi:uncharacterized protein (DUF1800 family)